MAARASTMHGSSIFRSTSVITPPTTQSLYFPIKTKSDRSIRLSLQPSPSISEATKTMDSEEPMKLLFVEMGVGYDQHGQDITVAAMRACKDAISSNSIPAFRKGSIPGVSTEHMKLKIKLGIPQSTQQHLDIDRVKSVFPY
ncbi:hypothetical protein QJS10_CPB20g01985 [Acorus calamus]|uniref:Uncharacterized protein n=1 Tax=Acorus calamus TaxID=4465 RepID=A0AAV9C899_ACOCL|nr:hypothetical protein QJS10_CPB20g01985 [Acorus calamus]